MAIPNSKTRRDMRFMLERVDNIKARIFEKVEMVTECGCWIWMGALTTKNYGEMRFRDSPGPELFLVHRIAFFLFRGAIPEELELDHLCRTTVCVNPWHLEPVTHEENMRRGRVGWNFREVTHCPQGHAYDGNNLIVKRKAKGRTSRVCRECRKVQRRNRWERVKGLAKERYHAKKLLKK